MKKMMFSVCVMTLLFTACKRNDDHHPRANGKIFYIESNDYHDGMNGIIAYRDSGNGVLSQLAGSPFMTGGAGIGNPMQILGPDDSDTPLTISADGKFLYAVNPGSNTIAVFAINLDGTLQPIEGSPFSSAGQTPVSVAIHDGHLYVVNKSQDPLHTITMAPNYSVFSISSDGGLSHLSTYETTEGVSPAQALVSNDGKFLFGADFLGFMTKEPVGTLRSFKISEDSLESVDGSPYFIPGMGGALGLWQHPKSDILYVGFPVQGKVGIYSIDGSSGALSFSSTIDAGPASCWIRTTKNGNYLYVLNSGENTVSVYNSSNAASPVAIDKLMLKNSGPLYTAMGMSFATSEDFSLAFSADEKYLYIISQHTNPDFTIGNYNYMHVLEVGSDGKLSESSEPMQIPVAADVRTAHRAA